MTPLRTAAWTGRPPFTSGFAMSRRCSGDAYKRSAFRFFPRLGTASRPRHLYRRRIRRTFRKEIGPCRPCVRACRPALRRVVLYGLPGRLRTFRLGAVDAGGRRRDLSRRRVWLVARVLRKEDALAPVTRGSAERAIDAALFDPHGRKRKFS